MAWQRGRSPLALVALALLSLARETTSFAGLAQFPAATAGPLSRCAVAPRIGRGLADPAPSPRRRPAGGRATGARMALDPATVEAGTRLLGTGLGFPVGFILGVLGGGGSILALPIFLFALQEPTQTAIAESLVVVSIGAGVGFLAKLKEGVNLEIAAPFAALAMTGSFLTAKVAGSAPEGMRLGMFTLFAITSSVSMWQSAQEKPRLSLDHAGGEPEQPPEGIAPGRFNTRLGGQALGVGALTSMIGAGGGFVIMPALTLVGGIPVKKAVTSSLLIICLNSATAFASYVGEVPLHWQVIVPFAGTVAAGAVAGSAFSKSVPQNLVKKLFSGTVLALCTGLLAWKLPAILANLHVG